MHELKTSGISKVAEKMMMTEEDGSKSIEITDLGENVLTLYEVLQTFDEESAMFNIKLWKEDRFDYRTVVLRKNKVEFDGRSKVIIMIRDMSDRVRLE